MTTQNPTRTGPLVAACLLLLALPVSAAEVPAQLPDPDGKSGDATKPVKVYILAGQSNMVGMGTLSGATNRYDGLFLSTDPAAPIGPLNIYKVGSYKIDRCALYLSDGTKTQEPIAQGQLEVPESGNYRVNCGSGDSSYCVMQLDGKEVYRRASGGTAVLQDVTLEAGKRYEFKISGYKGDAPRFWMQKTELLGHGDLEIITKRDKTFQHLINDKGEWTVRKDVYFYEAELAFAGGWLTVPPRPGKNTIGPELQFGHIMGHLHDELVLVIKTSNGNRSLGFDYRPPSSGRNDPASEWEGKSYRLMVDGVRKTLGDIKNIVPDYKGQGYEIAGFVWWQGHTDQSTPRQVKNDNWAESYEKYL